MDVVFDINVILDLVCFREPHHEAAARAYRQIVEQRHRPWVYSGSALTLRYNCAVELYRRQFAPTRPDALRKADRLLHRFLVEFQWLAALAGDCDNIFTTENPESAQLTRALNRLPADARLLTRDTRLLESCSQAIAPADFVRQAGAEAHATEAAPIPLVDLAGQQDRLRPQIEDRIHRVLHHGKYILGPEVDELEERLASYVGVSHCIGVASGTDALQIALMALGIGPGDEVITVPYTWISTAEVIALIGAKPVFVDIEPDTWNMDPERIADAITSRTKAIMPVGIYGQTADMTAINAVARDHGNIPVIEDAAQSFGATHHGKRSCALSTIGCTSFFPSKPLGAYGDGGAIFTSDNDLAEKMRQIRVHGQSRKHHHPILGLNGRLDTLQAAVILAKLDAFDDEIVRRVAVARRYTEALKGFCTSPCVHADNTHVYAQYTIRHTAPERLKTFLTERNIPSAIYYRTCLHQQPVFQNLGCSRGDFPEAERAAAEGLSLPMHPFLSPSDQESVIKAIVSFRL